jgi:hypothetical protein
MVAGGGASVIYADTVRAPIIIPSSAPAILMISYIISAENFSNVAPFNSGWWYFCDLFFPSVQLGWRFGLCTGAW